MGMSKYIPSNPYSSGIPLNAIREYLGLGAIRMSKVDTIDRLEEILYVRGVDVKVDRSMNETTITCTTRHTIESQEDVDNICIRYEAYDKALDKVKEVVENVEESAIVERKINPDMVNHPKHYQSKSGLEVIDVIEAFTDGLNGIEASDTANIIKYACRWKDKNGSEDLRKIAWYANHLANYLDRK